MGDQPALDGRGHVLAVLALLAIGAGVCSGLLVSSSSATAATGVPAGNAAVVVGKPITVHTFDHWMYVAAKGEAATGPHAPVIVPTDPPRFLIKAHWYEDQAVAERITITPAEVRRALEKAKRQEFRSARAFRMFLKQTGQTAHDLFFRVRINLTDQVRPLLRDE